MQYEDWLVVLEAMGYMTFDDRVIYHDIPWTPLGLGKQSFATRWRSMLMRPMAMGVCGNGGGPV